MLNRSSLVIPDRSRERVGEVCTMLCIDIIIVDKIGAKVIGRVGRFVEGGRERERPGLRGTPAGMATTSQPFRHSSNSSSPW